MNISACMIVKNEAANITRALNSVKTIVNEMIVVDTGSADDTVELAKALGAKVYHFDWCDDFAAAKNYAIDRATGDWLLLFDADEFIDNKTAAVLPAVLDKFSAKYDGFILKRIELDKNNTEHGYGYYPRIIRNDTAIRYTGRIHENLCCADGRKLNMLTLNTDEFYFFHTGYNKDIIPEKSQRNLRILLSLLDGSSNDANYYMYLAETYYALDDYENTVKYAKLDIADEADRFIGTKAYTYLLLLDSLTKLNALQTEIADVLEQGLQRFPDMPDFYERKGCREYTAGAYEAALELLLTALTKNAAYKGMEQSVYYLKMPEHYTLIGNIYAVKNKPGAAADYYRQALGFDKYNNYVFIRYFKQLELSKTNSAALEQLTALYDMGTSHDLAFLLENIPSTNQYYCELLNRLAKLLQVDFLAESLTAFDTFQAEFAPFEQLTNEQLVKKCLVSPEEFDRTFNMYTKQLQESKYSMNALTKLCTLMFALSDAELIQLLDIFYDRTKCYDLLFITVVLRRCHVTKALVFYQQQLSKIGIQLPMQQEYNLLALGRFEDAKSLLKNRSLD